MLTELSFNFEKTNTEYINVIFAIYVLPYVQEVFNLRDFKTKLNEDKITKNLIGDTTINRGGLIDFVSDKINGAIIIYEMNKKSLIGNSEYKFYATQNNVPLQNYYKLLNDPIFRKLLNDEKRANVIGKFQEDVIVGYESEKKV